MIFRIVHNQVFYHLNSYLMVLSTGCDFGKIANLINVVQIMQLPPCRFWAAQAARAVYNSIFPQFTPHFCLTIGHDRRLCLWMDMLQCLKIPLEQGKP